MAHVLVRRRWGLNGPAFGRLHQATYWLVLGVVFTVPWQRVVLVDGFGTITRLVGFAAAGIAGLAVVAEGRHQRLVDAHILMILLTAWVGASLIWTIRPVETFQAAFTVVQLLAMAWMVTEFAAGRERMRGVMWAYVLGSAVTASILILQFFLLASTGAERYSAEGAHPNDIAFMLCLAVPMAWYLSLLARSQWVMLALWLTLPLKLMAILLTASRSSLILLIVAGLIIPLTWRRLSTGLRQLCLVIAVAPLPFILSVLPDRPMERLTTLTTGINDQTFGARGILMRAAWEITGQKPILGVGAGASRYGIESLTGMQEGAHNAYLSVLTELGVVGLTLFVLLLLATALRVLFTRGLEGRLALVLGLTLAVGLLPRHAEYDKATWLVIALLVGLGMYHGEGTEELPRADEPLTVPAASRGRPPLQRTGRQLLSDRPLDRL